jgi:hypothetical protein
VMVKVLVLRHPVQGALYLLPLFLHLLLEAIHVLLAFFALFLHCSVTSVSACATRAFVSPGYLTTSTRVQ